MFAADHSTHSQFTMTMMIEIKRNKNADAVKLTSHSGNVIVDLDNDNFLLRIFMFQMFFSSGLFVIE